MTEQKAKLPSTSFTLSLNAVGDRGKSSRTGRPATEASLRISTLPAGDILTVSPQSFAALVQVDAKCPSSIMLYLPDGSRKEALLHPGELFLLPPRSTATNLSALDGEIIRYEVSRAALRAFAQRSNPPRTGVLSAPSFGPDATLTTLSRAARPILLAKQRCPKDVAEYFTLTLYSHLLDRYGMTNPTEERFTGGLSPRHKRTISEALDDPLGQSLSMDGLAERCGLSVAHFGRAFRQSFGCSFHKYLLETRVARAQQLLVASSASLTEIAVAIGYADQQTFTESFRRVVGLPPGRYRRRFRLQVPEAHRPKADCLADQRATV
ncbi:Helix-turn-helix domain-containing protein [Bryocella elongata]|uniref:Helix-turn-helix domain-containing protein n=1 Tax=Bryocella elongata TaxID=863522 RepID=A0A1H6BRU0_9BACT|nr:Helix-turn-helix domain-containing protein [Bryocella elongata]